MTLITKGRSFLTGHAFLAAMHAMLAAGSASFGKRSKSSPRRQPRKDSQMRLQAAQAKRDRRALRNQQIKARGGYGR